MIPIEGASVISGMVDTHTHFSGMADAGVDTDAVLDALRQGDAGPVVDVAIEPFSLERRRRLCSASHRVYYTTGVHPVATGENNLAELLDEMDRQIDSIEELVAVGETGLDWVRLYAPREVQLFSFTRHIAAAERSAKPIIIHNRGAEEDVYGELRKATLPAGGIMHCFSSAAEWVDRFVELGMYISFAGNVTFRSADGLRESLHATPRERLLLETDAPYLAPVPVRGRKNSPALLGHLYRFVATELALSVEAVVDLVAGNAQRLFMW